MAFPIVPVQAKFLDGVGSVASTWMKFFQALVLPVRVALADAATLTLDASKGSVFDITLGGNRAVAAPLNPTDGQTILLRLTQDATGSRTVSWNAAFHFGTDLPTPTLTTTAGKTDHVEFTYNAGRSAWECVRITRGYP